MNDPKFTAFGLKEVVISLLFHFVFVVKRSMTIMYKMRAFGFKFL